MKRPVLRILPLLILALTTAVGAEAQDAIRIQAVEQRDEDLVVVLDLSEAFDVDARRSIERGLPITVRITAELWRSRSHWFDEQVDSRVQSFRIRWDPGARLFVLDELGRLPRRVTYPTLDEALEVFAPRTIEVHPFLSLGERHIYFVTLEVAIQPITLEEFRELEGWISGSIRGGPEETSGSDDGGGGLSGAVFGLLVNLSGFGDEIHRARSGRFSPSDVGTP